MSNSHLWTNLAKGKLTLQLSYEKKTCSFCNCSMQICKFSPISAHSTTNLGVFETSPSFPTTNLSALLSPLPRHIPNLSPSLHFHHYHTSPFHRFSLTWTTPVVIYSGLVTPLLKILCFLSHVESNPNFLPWQQGPTWSYNLTLTLLLTSPTTYSYHLFSLFSRHTGLFFFLSLIKWQAHSYLS